MAALLEFGRYALEGIEVMFALAATAALGAGLIWGRNADSAEPPPLNADSPREG